MLLLIIPLVDYQKLLASNDPSSKEKEYTEKIKQLERQVEDLQKEVFIE